MAHIVFNTKHFFHDKINRCFSGEISELVEHYLPGTRISKTTILLHSERTTQVAEFEFTQELIQNDEVVGWEFVPNLKTWTKHKGLGGYRLVIFND